MNYQTLALYGGAALLVGGGLYYVLSSGYVPGANTKYPFDWVGNNNDGQQAGFHLLTGSIGPPESNGKEIVKNNVSEGDQMNVYGPDGNKFSGPHKVVSVGEQSIVLDAKSAQFSDVQTAATDQKNGYLKKA